MVNGADAATSLFHRSDGFSLELKGTFYHTGKNEHGASSCAQNRGMRFFAARTGNQNSVERVCFLKVSADKTAGGRDHKSSS